MMKHIIAILCAALILASCNNFLTGSGDNVNDLNKSGVKITVSPDGANNRTLFPSANFSKYVLSFSGSATHADITLENGETSALLTDLANGSWTITAKGYVLINGTHKEAAEGSSRITVTSGQLQSVNISISAKQAGANGYLNYSVSFPLSLVDYAYLRIRPYNGGYEQDINLADNLSGSIFLVPGYYYMSISLYKDNETAAGLTEIVHIYSNMETKFEHDFTENDFTKMITISGTIDVKVNGQDPDEIYLATFLDENYQNYLTRTEVNTTDNTWSMRLAASDTEIPLYFKVYAYSNGEFYKEIGEGVRIKDQNESNITLASVNFSAITISGTVDVQVTGGPALQYAYVVVYEANGGNHYWQYLGNASVNIDDGSWSWRTASFDADTELYFKVEANVSTGDYEDWFPKETVTTVTVKDQDRSNINLGIVNFSFITLSGTINVSYGRNLVDEVYINAYTYSDYSQNHIRSFSLYSPYPDTPWSMTIMAFDAPTDVIFRVELYKNGDWYTGVVTESVHNTSKTNINIAFDPLIPVNPAPLDENVWKSGNIAVEYTVDWYSIDVTAGTTYYLWFNNQNGDWSQSLYGEVFVIDGDGNEIYNTDNAWYSHVDFTVDSGGTVFVRVCGLWGNTGTYELIYSTAENRPVKGAVNYVVTFNTNGGSDVPSWNVAAGATVKKPVDPVKDGYRFGGWYKEDALTNAWNFTTDTVTAKTTLYAKWNPKEPNTIVVTFEGFGDEFFDLTQSAYSISKSKGQGLQVTVAGVGDNYIQWYIDGSSLYGTQGDINIYAWDFPVGVHTLSAVVWYNSRPYSKELTFRVVY